MTICIAAMHNDGGIVGVSDKMFSTEAMAFEPKGTTKKVFALAPGIFALNAGHVALQAEIMEEMQTVYNAGKKEANEKNYTVKGMVDLYVDCFNRIRRQRINNSVFASYGLDEQTFLARQKDLSDVFVREMMIKVDQFQFPAVESIIAGIDNSTGHVEPHIYIVKRHYYENVVQCCDAVGYATIGSGSPHVEAYFMFSQFTRHYSLPKTIALSYFAKKRAELAPNVGKQTDMFLLGPTLGFNTNLATTLDYKMLDAMYENINENERICTEAAFEKLFEDLKGKLPIRTSQYDKS